MCSCGTELCCSQSTPITFHFMAAMCGVPTRRRVDDFELHKELYRGKTSLLYSATDRRSGIPVALKLYRKRKLSVLNR